jgi:hypothetical protein
LRRLESYEGVNGMETFITTKLVYYQDWVKMEIDKRLRSEVVEQWQLQQQQEQQEQQLATQ